MSLKNNKKKYLCVVASGSGGHILPALVLAKKWLKQNLDGEVIFLGSKRLLDNQIASFFDVDFKKINLNLCNFPGKKLWHYPRFFWGLGVSFFKSIFCLKKFKPEYILSTGGYLSIPACFAAKMLSIPIKLYELNVVPGRAINLLLSIADKVVVVFEACKHKHLSQDEKIQKKVFVEDYPIRYESKQNFLSKNDAIVWINRVLRNNENTLRYQASGSLGCDSVQDDCFIPFDFNRKTIFIMGGSQGSLFINSLFQAWLDENPNYWSKVQVIHQTGSADTRNWHSFYREKQIPSFIFSYYQDCINFYAAADLVVSRAGAGTLFELEFFKKRSIIIPLKTNQTDHQIFNAQEISKKNSNFVVLHSQGFSNSLLEFSNNLSKILFL